MFLEIVSNCSKRLMYESIDSLLAPGLAALKASAAATSTAMIVLASLSPWCVCIASTTASGSLYLLARLTPISTCEPSTSWSIAFPISCSNPARFAKTSSSPISTASFPARKAHSIECLRTFCP